MSVGKKNTWKKQGVLPVHFTTNISKHPRGKRSKTFINSQHMSTVLLRQHFIVRLRVPAKTARTAFSHHNSHQSRHASVASTTNPSTIPASTPTRSEKSATANIQQERNLHVVPIAQSRTSTERKNVGSLSFNNDGKSGKLQQSVVGNGSVGENRAVDAAPERRKNSVEKSIGATRGYGSSSARPAVGLSNGTVRQWADAAPSPTRVDAVVIGAGQAGLSVAYHLQKAGGLRFVTLDANQVGFDTGGKHRLKTERSKKTMEHSRKKSETNKRASEN